MKTEKTAAAQIRHFFWLLIIFNLRSPTIASVFHTSGRKKQDESSCDVQILQNIVSAGHGASKNPNIRLRLTKRK